MDSVHDNHAGVEPITGLCRFRDEFYSCLGARADAQFELTEALLCADGPVRTLVDLSLAPEHRRGHGALYDGLNHGSIEIARLRRGVAGVPLPRVGERIVLAADVSPWLRPDAETSPARLFCHVHGRAKGTAQMIPGWPYSVVAALGSGRSSWTAVLDAVRLGPTDDATAVTAAQLRETVNRLRQAGHWRPGDPSIWIVLDSGYDLARLAFLLAELPVVLIGRLRSDRVLARPVGPRPGGRGRPRRHGPLLVLADPATWPAPEHTSATDTTRYGIARASAWHRCHARLEHRGPWRDHPGPLPIIEGTLIRLQVAHLPGDRAPKPLWLWTSDPTATGAEIDRAWQAFLRRFDLEHTFRFFKQTLGLDQPEAARSRRRRPLDLADHRRAYPTAAGSGPGHRPAAPLGTTLPTRAANPSPSPPRISPPPTEDHPSSPCAETQPTRPRTPTRHPQPAPSTPPRRRQDHHTRSHQDRPTADQGLNIKRASSSPGVRESIA